MSRRESGDMLDLGIRSASVCSPMRRRGGKGSGAQAYLDGTSSTRGKPNAADTGRFASAAKGS